MHYICIMERKSLNIDGRTDIYDITEDGKIWSHRKSRWLRGAINSAGYVYYYLSAPGKDGAWYFAHRLVYETFIGPIKDEINHKDGDKLNNHISNLEDITHQDNIQKARKLKPWKSGRAPGFSTTHSQKEAVSKANSKEVCAYRNGQLVHQWPSLKLAAAGLGCSYATVQRALKRSGPSFFKEGPLDIRYRRNSLEFNEFCPISCLPEVDFSKMGTKLERIAKNLYASAEGYRVAYYHKGEFVEKWFKSREAILKYYKLPDDFPKKS